MPQVSKRHLDQRLEKRIFEVFFDAFAKINNPLEIQSLLEDLLSPIERTMLGKRLAIAILLQKGWTYEAIMDTVKVSDPTVSKVNYWLKNRGEGFRKVFKQLIFSNKIADVLDTFEEVLLTLQGPAALSSGKFFRKSEKGKEIYRSRLSRQTL